MIFPKKRQIFFGVRGGGFFLLHTLMSQKLLLRLNNKIIISYHISYNFFAIFKRWTKIARSPMLNFDRLHMCQFAQDLKKSDLDYFYQYLQHSLWATKSGMSCDPLGRIWPRKNLNYRKMLYLYRLYLLFYYIFLYAL